MGNSPAIQSPSPVKKTVVRLLQPQNAELPIEVTELGIVTLVRPLQRENALLPIEVTELGMVMLVRLLQ